MKNFLTVALFGLSTFFTGCGPLLDALENPPAERNTTVSCSPGASSQLSWGDRNEGYLYYEQRLLRTSATPQAYYLNVAKIENGFYDIRISFRRAGYGGPEVTGLELVLSRYADTYQTPTLQTICRLSGDQVFTCEIRNSRVTLNRNTSDVSTIHQLAQVRVTYRINEGPEGGTYTSVFTRSDLRFSNCVYGQLGKVAAGDLGTETFPPVYELN